MSKRRKVAQSSRKRALSHIHKMRGSLKGGAAALEYLLKERRREFEKKKKRLKD